MDLLKAKTILNVTLIAILRVSQTDFDPNRWPMETRKCVKISLMKI
jgi:hypothetical protein